MIFARWSGLLTGFILSMSHALYAEEPLAPPAFLPAESTHINWTFSGVVANENGENYGYLFQMQREDNQFHVITALFDAQTKQLLIQEDSHAILSDANTFNWQVGHSFLRFNPINASWIFGLKDGNKKGFNFKIDMLKQSEREQTTQGLRQGVEMMVRQTGQLNGHIQFDDNKEQFVTAKNAWFRQFWLTDHQEKTHQLSGVLCRFNDGSAFYSMNMPEADALRGATAGWFDPQGLPTTMSQFINVKQMPEGGAWHIRIASPSLHLILNDSIQHDSVVAGFIDEKDRQGFCMLSNDAIGDEVKAPG